ncbi:hypothetical protein JX265_004484 [Neoarthrinium moseri]|uniref:Uncharacterized protein n=1 Tax=Neoarthrinium moseri TaxID=1658444 RepID=A0A9P9WR77_9PEZI|nr:uncharacterized protein JN550_010853 [Neoarthrinium moseri]KAI1850773.1 hypothetical protein JX266_004055 [Neoarthrinium moseri]KAI1861473.1 hypothetical protein JN550_010853 [Neoarthrinium moseri]KAI1875426.1 hypothetical protein JX265_004484 [Neoarthrinium moseri]
MVNWPCRYTTQAPAHSSYSRSITLKAHRSVTPGAATRVWWKLHEARQVRPFLRVIPLQDGIPTFIMPAINTVVARDALSTIAKRENWAQQEAGVVVVFCIVFVVAAGLLALWLHKCITARKARKQTV